MTSSGKLVFAFVLVSLAISVAGCNGASNQTSTALQPSPEATRIAELVRTRTDEFLLKLASGDLRQVRQYYPPNVDVDLKYQMTVLLQVPPKESFRVTQWNANVDVALAPNHLKAQIRPVVQVRVGTTQPVYQKVGLNWVPSDKTWQTFYLEPLK
jgi:hypothetical protein